jgi:Domain of unknown function (DUF4034)
MQWSFFFRCGLALFCGSQCLHPNASRSSEPTFLGDTGTDIEKARLHIRERKATRLRWELATTLGEYDRIGKKDPRWNEPTRNALTQNAYLIAGDSDADDRREKIKAAFEKALAAGCTDPLVTYFALRLGCHPADASMAELADRFATVERQLQESQYPAIRKCYAALRAAEYAWKAVKAVSGGDSQKFANSMLGLLNRAGTQYVMVLEDPLANRDSVYDLTENALLDFARDAPAGRLQILEPVAKFLQNNKSKIAGDDPGAGLIEGDFWSQYAWDARSSNWSSEVTAEGWRLFAERLEKAEQVLEKAWEKDPHDSHIAIQMMTVELGQGKGRERLETWFRRAMNADPDSCTACQKKLLYLQSKWYGSEAEALAFGRQCLATANWSSRIPFVVLTAHIDLAEISDAPERYWTRAEVWADIRQLYDGFLAGNPNSIYDLSGYALYAYRAEQWKLASELFAALGDKPDLRELKCTMQEYQQMRRTAAARTQGSR